MNENEIKKLIAYAKENLGLKDRDCEYKSNRIAELSSVFEGGALEDAVFGELSLLPSQIDENFWRVFRESSAKSATDWFYGYCVNNRYVKKAVLDKNPRYTCSNGLVITINKAKPEFRDPNKARAGNSVEGGFAKCVICRENEGFGARDKRNLRTVSIKLSGKPWFWQYSPYGYFPEHGIAVNCGHIPMHIDRETFLNLLDFVDTFPHYFIGCNAPLERIGGSVLAHDHYQGGGEILPLQKADIKTRLKDRVYPYVTVGILDWAGSVIRIKSDRRGEIVDIADRLRAAWENYDNKRLGIVSRDEKGVHNAISPTVIKTRGGYEMNVILRSNVTSPKYPDGVFHAHPEYHAIKKESIGLIEAQGLFILPGRLEEELGRVKKHIFEGSPLTDDLRQFDMFYNEAAALYGSGKYDVDTAVREELGSICRRILENTAVFKREQDFLAFLSEASFDKA